MNGIVLCFGRYSFTPPCPARTASSFSRISLWCDSTSSILVIRATMYSPAPDLLSVYVPLDFSFSTYFLKQFLWLCLLLSLPSVRGNGTQI